MLLRLTSSIMCHGIFPGSETHWSDPAFQASERLLVPSARQGTIFQAPALPTLATLSQVSWYLVFSLKPQLLASWGYVRISALE